MAKQYGNKIQLVQDTSSEPENPDFADRVVNMVIELMPDLRESRRHLTASIRREFGVSQQYVRRPGVIMTCDEVLQVFNGRSATEVARVLGCSRATVYRLLKRAGPKV